MATLAFVFSLLASITFEGTFTLYAPSGWADENGVDVVSTANFGFHSPSGRVGL
jgi:hypothetical protein